MIITVVIFRQKGANGIANSEGPDQTAPLEQRESSCSDTSFLISVGKFKISE